MARVPMTAAMTAAQHRRAEDQAITKKISHRIRSVRGLFQHCQPVEASIQPNPPGCNARRRKCDRSAPCEEDCPQQRWYTQTKRRAGSPASEVSDRPPCPDTGEQRNPTNPDDRESRQHHAKRGRSDCDHLQGCRKPVEPWSSLPRGRGLRSQIETPRVRCVF